MFYSPKEAVVAFIGFLTKNYKNNDKSYFSNDLDEVAGESFNGNGNVRATYFNDILHVDIPHFKPCRMECCHEFSVSVAALLSNNGHFVLAG
jgi:hypothetical protein